MRQQAFLRPLVRVEKGFEALADELREQILSGTILPGTALPNERELGELSGLSRGSVREALRVLEAQGLVATAVGRNGGRRVVEPSSAVLVDAMDFLIRGQNVQFSEVLETMAMLHPTLASLAARHRSARDIDLLERLEADLSAAIEPSDFEKLNAQWHLAVARAAHNVLLTAISEVLIPRIYSPYASGIISAEVQAAAIKAKKTVRLAIAKKDSDAAQRRMARHVFAYSREVERKALAGKADPDVTAQMMMKKRR